MFKVNNKEDRTTSPMSIDVFFIKFEQPSHIVLVFLLLILKKEMSTGNILMLTYWIGGTGLELRNPPEKLCKNTRAIIFSKN